MNRQQKEIIVLIVLTPIAAVLIFSAANYIRRKKAYPPREKAAQTATVQPPVKETPRKPDMSVKISGEDHLKMRKICDRVLEAGGEWPCDPFLLPPLPLATITWEGVNVQGIIWAAHGAVAIIEGVSVEEGDSVQGFKVEKINADSVILSKDGREVSIRMD